MRAQTRPFEPSRYTHPPRRVTKFTPFPWPRHACFWRMALNYWLGVKVSLCTLDACKHTRTLGGEINSQQLLLHHVPSGDGRVRCNRFLRGEFSKRAENLCVVSFNGRPKAPQQKRQIKVLDVLLYCIYIPNDCSAKTTGGYWWKLNPRNRQHGILLAHWPNNCREACHARGNVLQQGVR